jgi:hypothetical protein
MIGWMPPYRGPGQAYYIRYGGIDGSGGRANEKWKGGEIMDFSNMGISDWIIRTAIFGVLACAVLGTLQNIIGAIKGRKTGK